MFSTPTVVGSLVYIGSCAGVFYALDKHTGQVRWSYNIHNDGDQTSFHGNPLVTQDMIIIGTDGEGVGHVYAFERETGRVVWKFKVTDEDSSGRRGVATDILRLADRVYGVTLDDRLICLDLLTGRLNWSFQKPYSKAQPSWSQSPAVVDEKLYFGALNGTLYKLNPGNGEVIWSRDLGARISTSPAPVARDIFVGAVDRHLYKLSQTSGKVLGSIELENIPAGSLVLADRFILAVLNSGGSAGGSEPLICIDPASGKILWSQHSEKEWSMREPLVWRKTVLAGDEGGRLFAYKIADGKTEWTRQFPGMIRSIGSDGDTLFIGTLSGTVYAYVPTNSDKL